MGPSLDLTVAVTKADGTQRRWASHLPAADRPSGLQFTTARFEGFKTAQCTLPRRIDRDYVDLNLFDDYVLFGVDGSVAYEGRIAALPRSMDAGHSVTVQAVGWMAHAKDRKIRDIIIDRDLSRWGPPAAGALTQRFAAGYNPSSGRTDVRPASAEGIPALWQTAQGVLNKPDVFAFYDAGPGNVWGFVRVKKIDSFGLGAGDSANWDLLAEAWSDDATYDSGSADQAAGVPVSNFEFSPATKTRYANLMWRYNLSSAGTAGQDYGVWWQNVAVHGNHGLPVQGDDYATQGYTASDVIKHIVASYCPKLNTRGVQDTKYPISHLAWHDPVFPYDAMLACNAYHLWGLELWEDRTLYFGPVDMSDYDWQVRLTDHGVTVELQGDSTDDLANGIVVTYQDAQKGAQNRLTPDTYTELVDDAVENPANRAGLNVWTELQVSQPVVEDNALQIGRIALAEFNSPKAPGTINVRGHIRDRAGHWQQAWKPRAGETIAIVDHPNDRPRLISETSWNHDTQTMQITVEGMPRRLDALLDRLGNDLGPLT